MCMCVRLLKLRLLSTDTQTHTRLISLAPRTVWLAERGGVCFFVSKTERRRGGGTVSFKNSIGKRKKGEKDDSLYLFSLLVEFLYMKSFSPASIRPNRAENSVHYWTTLAAVP